MGISGLVGAGASDGLDQVIIQQLAKQKFAEQVRAQQAEEAQRAAQMAQQGEQFNARMAQDATQHQDVIDSQAANRRQQANQWGVEDMMRQAAAMQPKPVKLTKITKMGPNGKPIATGVTDEELAAGVEEYREPKVIGGGGDTKRQWLVRGGKKVYDTYRPGDEPYEKGSAAPSGGANPARAAAELAEAADALLKHPGRPAAFGVVNNAFPTVRQDTADAEILADRVKALLTVENMDKMKGVLSDSDIKILQSAGTTLNGRMSDQAAVAELKRVIAIARQAVTGGAPVSSHGPSTPAAGAGAGQVVRGPNGKLMIRR